MYGQESVGAADAFHGRMLICMATAGHDTARATLPLSTRRGNPGFHLDGVKVHPGTGAPDEFAVGDPVADADDHGVAG
jgi:hypothetical protein